MSVRSFNLVVRNLSLPCQGLLFSTFPHHCGAFLQKDMVSSKDRRRRGSEGKNDSCISMSNLMTLYAVIGSFLTMSMFPAFLLWVYVKWAVECLPASDKFSKRKSKKGPRNRRRRRGETIGAGNIITIFQLL